jgi:hypothetical protein
MSAHAQAGKKHAVLIGIKEWESSKFPELRFTENDVNNLKSILDEHGYSVRLLSTSAGKADVKDKPTAKNIKAAIVAALKEAKTREDMVVVAFSGHGIQKTVGGQDQNFICPSDAQLNDDESIISVLWIFEQFKDAGTGVKLLLVDACRDRPAGAKSVNTLVNPRPPSGTAALFSCKSDEQSLELETLKGGVFFHFVIRALKGEASQRDGRITWNDFAGFVTERVALDSPKLIGDGGRQTPQEIREFVGAAPLLVKLAPLKEEVKPFVAKKPLPPPPPVLGDFERGYAAMMGKDRAVDYSEGFRLLLNAANNNHAIAQGMTAQNYFWGFGVKQDKELAATWGLKSAKALEKAAAGGDMLASITLAGLYLEGIGVEKEEKRALKLFAPGVEKNDVGALTAMGYIYLMGKGVERSPKEAVKWFTRAATQGYTKGMNNLAFVNEFGMGVDPRNPKEAVRLYQAAARKNDPHAMVNLGRCMAYGIGIAPNVAEGRRWIEKAMAYEELDAFHQLAVLFEIGKLGKPDQKVAAGLLRQAAERGSPPAQHRLGLYYLHGMGGLPKSKVQAGTWFAKAAEQGNAEAKKELDKLEP